jgi:signal peptidase II
VSGRRIGWRVAYFFAAFGIYLVDQMSKAWAVRSLRSGESVTLVGGLLDLTYAENPGIAFGQLQKGGSFGRWALVGLAVAAGVFVIVYLFRTARTDDRVLGACALLLAGIAGNLTDRARFGFVIDFILLHYRSFSWPVFNVADLSISAGAFLLIFDIFVSGRSARRKKRAEVVNTKSEPSTN